MWKIVRLFLAQHKNDAGFTLIEAITMVGVLSLLGVVLWSGATLAMRAITDINLKIDITNKTLKAEYMIRDKCRAVKFPFWLKEPDMESGENDLKIYYYKGNKESTLNFSFKDDLLRITEHIENQDSESQDLQESYGPFSRVQFSMAEGPRGIYGIRVELWPKTESKDDDQVSAVPVIAEFGGIPLWNKNNDQE
jgi:hypothetical protein